MYDPGFLRNQEKNPILVKNNIQTIDFHYIHINSTVTPPPCTTPLYTPPTRFKRSKTTSPNIPTPLPRRRCHDRSCSSGLYRSIGRP